MSRRELVDRLVALVGPDIVTVADPLDGWPSLVRVRLDDGNLLTAMHLGPVGLSHRGRDEVERRFQNPGQNRPVSAPGHSLPLLLGIWEQGQRPILVGMEAEARLGRSTRQSLFIPLWLLHQAADSGWSEHFSTSGELIIGFHPALLPTYIETRRSGLSLEAEQISSILQASGVTASPEQLPAERARRASSALVRSAKFAKAVVEAYEGLCAMCGLDFGLVQAAHIYPVQAPNSVDEIWNGLALCSNHHTAFDRHLFWIEPSERSVKLHPNLLSGMEHAEVTRLFVKMTFPRLRPPISRQNAPTNEMFNKRYEFFGEKYAWVHS